jgi:hypothetical protein
MAWKLILTDVHGRQPDRAVYALQVRLTGDTAEIHKTDSTIELVSLNNFQISTWTRDELWKDLRKLAGGMWFDGGKRSGAHVG